MKSQQAALEATSPDRQKDQRKSDKAKNQDSKESLRKRITRKWLLPFFENRICKSHPDGAQMARYILHTKCGLTDDQAKALRDYFTSYEALGLAIQRGEWLSAECDRIKGRLDKKTGGEDSADTTRLTVEFREIWNEVRKNRMVWLERDRSLQLAQDGLHSTAIARALIHCRSQPGWHMHYRLQQRCWAAGGCCGRSCGCCTKRSADGWHEWVGHCTPACVCCMKYYGVEKPIENLNDPIELGFSLFPEDDGDTLGFEMMEGLVWQPESDWGVSCP